MVFSARKNSFDLGINTNNSPAVIGRGALASLAFEGREHLPAIDLPTLVITAQEDRVTRIEAAREMQRRLPQAELVSLSPAGHMGPWERHEAFAQAVAQFAQRHLAELPSQPSRGDGGGGFPEVRP